MNTSMIVTESSEYKYYKTIRINEVDKNKLYYLASPYSHSDPAIEELRYNQINEIGTILIKAGHMLIEPIAMCHHKKKYNLPGSYEFWSRINKKLISVCDGIIIAKVIDGWDKSIGVADEIKYAQSLDKEVYYLTEE
jgi:hypothetical protein